MFRGHTPGRNASASPPRPPLRWIGVGVALLVVAVGIWLVLNRRPAPDLSLQRVQKAGVIVIGLDPSYPPFEVDDGHGHLAGFDVDLANAVGQGLGVKVRFVSIDFGSIFDALEVGKFDAIIGGVSPDPDYAKTLAYSVPYYDDGLILVENPSVAPPVLGIESGSDADLDQAELRPKLTGYRFQQFDDQSEIQSDLQAKKLRGAIVDAVTGAIWAHQIPGLVAQPRRLTSSTFVIAVRTGDQKLLRAIDQQIVVLRSDGRISQLEQEWFKG